MPVTQVNFYYHLISICLFNVENLKKNIEPKWKQIMAGEHEYIYDDYYIGDMCFILTMRIINFEKNF
jgi:hypothetical protein